MKKEEKEKKGRVKIRKRWMEKLSQEWRTRNQRGHKSGKGRKKTRKNKGKRGRKKSEEGKKRLKERYNT